MSDEGGRELIVTLPGKAEKLLFRFGVELCNENTDCFAACHEDGYGLLETW